MYTDALPDDALADILSRLPPRDLAASRCVRKAWLAVVDARRLLHSDLLPHSVRGLFINYMDYDPPRLFARPSALPAIDLSFLPLYGLGFCTTVDHCNGLLLCWEEFCRKLCVVNPATRRWDYVVWKDKNAQPYLVFDPAASPHYEVLSIRESQLEQYKQKSDREQDEPHDLMELPPSLWTLNVFSSSTRQWKMRSFIREDDVAGTMPNVRLDPLQSIDMCWGWGAPRWRRYSAYWRGSLYVHCNDVFVVRLSLSECKYQLIKAPTDIEKTEHVQFLGKSEKELYLAMIYRTCQLRVWSLTESSGQINWVLKHNVDLEPLSMACLRDLRGFNKTWTIAGDEDDYNKEGVQKENNEMVMSEDRGWNSDDENFLNIDDYDTCYRSITFLGFHPYREVLFLGLPSFVGVAYHLKSSKVQYLGKMRPKDYQRSPTNGIYESFPYTPCMIGELLEQASEGPCGH